MAVQTVNFSVKNVKCGACVSTIRDGLMGINGVQAVDVIIEGGAVTVSGENLDRTVLTQKLGQLGYPEA